MPTLEERKMESTEDLRDRLEARTRELGITYTFSQYMEMMETYLLKLEQRVKRLEENCNVSSDDIMAD
jgi:glutamate-1-semialdehyde aminotransferase